MPAGVCLTIGHAFWCSGSLSAKPAGVLPHYRPCLLVWWLFISLACWCVSSLKFMHSDVHTHYQPMMIIIAITSDMSADPVPLSDMPACVVKLHQTCPLVRCLVINRACWCCVSLSAMHSGGLCHYWPCLLVCCLAIDCAYWCGASLSTILLKFAHLSQCWTMYIKKHSVVATDEWYI